MVAGNVSGPAGTTISSAIIAPALAYSGDVKFLKYLWQREEKYVAN